jgi:hypothetical protein
MSVPGTDDEAVFKRTIAGDLMLRGESALLSDEAKLLLGMVDGHATVQLLASALPQISSVPGLCASLEANGMIVRVLPEYRKRIASDETAFDDTMPPPLNDLEF